MKKEVLNETIKEERIDKEVLNAYYNICRYYNKNSKIINKFLSEI